MEVLLAGNTRYVTASFVGRAFPGSRVVVLGNDRLHTDHGAGIVSVGQPALHSVLDSHAFDVVVWFSSSLTPGGASFDEVEPLRALLDSCGEDTRVICLTARPLRKNSGEAVLTHTEARLCSGAAAKLCTVMLPWLYDAAVPGDLLGLAFEALEQGETFLWPAARDCPVAFLAREDLAELLYRILERWPDGHPLLTVPDSFGLTMGTLADGVHALWPGAPAPRFAQVSAAALPDAEDTLRREYHWFPRFCIQKELAEQQQRWRERRGHGPARRSRAQEWLQQHPAAVRLAELLLGCLGAELLTLASGAQMQFKFIDFRLLYIVLMGTVYGMQWGIAAAGLESLCLTMACARQNIGWLTLFYEPTNWVVFIAYFTVGAVCGYVRGKSRDMMTFARQENDTLRRKFVFLRQLCQETADCNTQLRRQIVASRDSFGKIFRVTQELDVTQPREVFLKAVQVLETLLQNDSAAIYSVSGSQRFARLEASSRAVARSAAPSLRMETLAPALPALERGEVWVNTGFLPGLPAYLAAARQQDGMVLLVALWQAPYEQMTLYFQNLFQVLCGLIRSSLLRALQSQRTRREQECLPGTFRLLRPAAFRRQVELARQMEQAHVASYQLLRLDKSSASPAELDHALAGRIRENDAAGLLEDGCVWLLLTQATPQTLPFVMQRLRQAGLPAQGIKELP